MHNLRFVALACAALVGGTFGAASAQAQDCNDLYNPNQVLTFNITMDPTDWETLRFSCPGGRCPPSPHTYFQATLQCGSTGPILVGIRRKSDLADPSEADPQKVSLKLDINEFIPGQTFAGKKKLSLENGGEGALLTEGLTWQTYQAAGGFVSGRCAWVNVYVNGDHKGLYSNVEQVDKVFLVDHGLDDSGWLIKAEDQRTHETPLELNPFAFNWYPFDHPDPLVYPELPAPPDWRDQALWRVNMPSLLSFAAAESFVASIDGLVNKMTNYFYYDWSILPGHDPAGQQPRLYFPWDLDTSMRGQDTDLDVLDAGAGHLEQGLIEELDEAGLPFPEPTFRADYFTAYKSMLNGPLALSQTLALVNGLEPLLSPHMNADPHQQTGLAAGEFQRIRSFLEDRTNSIVAQCSALGEGHPLQTSVQGSGTVVRNPDKPTIYDPNELVELTAVADPGWHFVAWANGVASTDNPLLITVDGPESVTAFFAQTGETIVIYDFNAKGGVDRFAYGTYTDSWADDLEGTRRKCPEVCTEVTTITANAYSRLALSDAIGNKNDRNRYTNPDEGPSDESTLIVEFNIAEDPAEVLQLDALWEGYGDHSHHMELYIWNYAQGNWGNGAGSVGENNFLDDGSGDADFTLSGSVTTDVSEYISPAGQVTLLIYDDSHSEDTFHDYVRAVVTVPAGECQGDGEGDCNDGNPCTDDTCVAGSCVYTPNDANPCDDGLFCTASDACSGGVCTGSGDPCPGQQCDEATDTCVDCLIEGDCADGVGCTDDACVAGSCVYTPDAANCDDGL
ncbi:MAG: CotH kinase family protein, partial [Planctomycetota bacterium]